MNIRYITDSNGSKTAVVIPIKDWEKHNKELNSLNQMLKLKHSIKSSFAEVKSSLRGKKKLKKFSDLHK
jgi:hypothetical protein